jgi:hypothetical protein
MGMLAGLQTKSGELCYLGNIATAGNRAPALYNSFFLGAHSIRSDIKVYVYDIATFSNITLAVYAVQKCFTDHPNADIFTTQTNDIDPYRWAVNKGIRVIAQPYDMRSELGDLVIGAAPLNWFPIFWGSVNSLSKNVTQPTIIHHLVNGAFDFVYDSNLNSAETKLNMLQIVKNISVNGFDGACSNVSKSFMFSTTGNYTCIPNFTSSLLATPQLILTQNITIPVKQLVYVYPAFSQDASATVLFIIGLVLGIFFAFNIVTVFLKRKDINIIRRRPVFLHIQNFGCIILLLSVFVIIGYPTSTTCYLQLIFLLIGFDLFYLPFLVKALRLYIIFTFDLTKKIKLPDWFLLGIISCFLFIDCFILIAWFIQYPITIKSALFLTDSNNIYYYLSCNLSEGYLIGIMIYKVILCAVVWIITDLASQIVFKVSQLSKERRRKIRKMNDAIDMKFGITFTFILLTIILMILLVIQTNPINTFIGISITVYIAIVIPMSKIMYSILKDLSNPSTNTAATIETGGKSSTVGSR